jgi:holo-[acyl-carrier protein] synthase
MIVGIGMDLISVDRVGRLIERFGDRALERLYTPEEVAYCRGRSAPHASFAARFAAKEALFKALGTGWAGGMAWWEVEVRADETGAPGLRLSGLAAQQAAALGATRVHVSLTHTHDLAGAYVVLES